MIRVASYCRVSTDKADQANSFEAQMRYFKEYIQRNSEWVLADIYADEGITGTSTRKRVQFNRMMSDAYDDKFDLLITKEVSRFSRNILDTISYTRELKSLGIHVIFMNDGFSTADSDSELRLSIMGSIAQEESRKTSSRVIWGQTRQMERGVVFGRSLLGYDVKNGKLTINPEGAELVQLIFHKYAVEKVGTTALCSWLEDKGYRTFSGSTHWNNSSIVKLLKNEKYVGDLVQKKTYTPDYLTHEKKVNPGEKIVLRNHHQPIVERELWELAQAELKKNNKHGNTDRIASNKCLFSGLILCGECGRGFVSRSKRGCDGTVYRRWACSGQNCHVGRILRDDDARNMIKTALCALQLDIGAIVKDMAKLVSEAIRAGNGSNQNLPEKLQAELKKQLNKKATALDCFLEGSLSRDELELVRRKYDAEILNLQKQLNQAQKLPEGNLQTQICQRTADYLSGKVESNPFYKSIADHITVFRDRHLELRFQGLPHVFRYTDCVPENDDARTTSFIL